MDDVQKISFLYGIKTKNYWTDDIDEVVGVMRYILPYSEYRMLKKKSDSDRWEALHIYWKEQDPSPETPENELLQELNERVKFSNKNFSILMHGWRTDRGRIYIIYGEPQLVDDSYQDNMGYHYQKWVYSNGKEFIFIDRTMSGDYTLYQERF
jgi:GWxTD domain-containing protein